jgi:hypothetical protein
MPAELIAAGAVINIAAMLFIKSAARREAEELDRLERQERRERALVRRAKGTVSSR